MSPASAPIAVKTSGAVDALMVTAQRVVGALFDTPPAAQNRRLFGVFDGARSPSVHELVKESGLSSRCLFRGPISPALEQNAPWLVHLDRAAPAARELACEAFGRSWGILLETIADEDVLARHLRGFLRVRDADGRRLFFRFFDPRVLRTYLPTLDAKEAATFTGPVLRYLVEDEAGTGYVEHVRGPDGILSRPPST